MILLRITAFTCLATAAATTAAQGYQSLYNFGLNTPNSPGRSLAQSRGGTIFTTTEDWNNQKGTVIRVTTAGQLTILHHFTTGTRIIPRGGVTLATDGLFYGTTQWGGLYGYGDIYRTNSTGATTILHNFTGDDGAYPVDAPIESIAGDFYGVTEGNANQGSIYKITESGVFTVLHKFPGTNDFPTGPLVQATNFAFYGTSCAGGANGAGSIFRFDVNGNYAVVYSFNTTDGACPQTGLLQASDGNLYGVTSQGGSTQNGVLFRLSLDGSFAVLHDFTGALDGAVPCTLIEASDGNLWGNAAAGGAYNFGTLFQITPGGTFTKVYDYDSTNGFNAESAHLLQHTSGVFFSDTSSGGPLKGGVFYSYDAGLPPFVSYLPVYGRAGAAVEILGQGFTADSVASFNGVPAVTTVVYPTYLKAIVPAGATSGYITVSTASGTLRSNKSFIVHP